MRKELLLYYGMQILGLAVPFILVPFFTRVLGTDGFGLLNIGQSLAVLIAAIVEYGFQMSATRRIAVCRLDLGQVGSIAADVLSAKCVLASLVIVLTPMLAVIVPVFRDHPAILVPSVAFGIFQGFSFYWLFGGIQRFLLSGILELAPKVGAALSILLLCRQDDPAWLALSLFAVFQGIFAAVGFYYYRRTLPYSPLSFPRARQALTEGKRIFAINVIGIFYTGTNSLLLGLISSPHAVGVFAGAEKLIRAAMLPMQPLRQVFFPVIAERISQSAEQGARLLWRMVYFSVPVALAGGCLLYLLAPFLVRIGLGEGMQESVAALRILCVLPAIGLVTEIITVFWMMPNRMDHLLIRVVALTACLHVTLMVVLGTIFTPAEGGAMAVVGSMAVALIVYVTIIWKKRSRTAN